MCYTGASMRPSRAVIAILTVLIWGVFTPVVMASSGCMAMGAMCEGPCGASSCVVSAPLSADFITLVAPASLALTNEPAQTVLPVLELPPK